MSGSQVSLNDIILDLSLASCLPTGAGGANYILATAAANALACRCDEMEPKDLRELEYTIIPLLHLMKRDIDDPVACKAAYGIRSLMRSDPRSHSSSQFVKPTAVSKT